MPDRDVVFSKIAIIQRCLKRIKDVTGFDPDSLDNYDKQDIFVLNLQRGIEASIGLATHVVAAEGLGLPETIKENFQLLCDSHIINREQKKKMKSMTGFRNIAVHDYKAIDVEILKTILTKHLVDLEDFYSCIVKHFKLV
ncbi:MAG: DUF86 domain-containing protein [Nitrospinota bacterium]